MNKTVKVAILQNYLDVFCDKNRTHDPFSCKDKKFETALLYMRCMNMSKNYEPVYVDQSYEPDTQMDILPFPFVVTDIYFDRNNHVTNPFLISSYKFFTAKSFDNSSVTTPDFSFLIHTFSSQLWIAFVAIVVLVKIVKEFATYTAKKIDDKNGPLIRSTFQLLHFLGSVFLAMLLGLYASNLKAKVSVKIKPLAPFNNIEELTNLVQLGKKTLVNDSFNITYVWRVLSGKSLINKEYPSTLRKLYEATYSNPAIEISQISEICRLLKEDTNLVYVGRENDLNEFCPDDCFWSVDVPEIPTVFRSFLFSNESHHVIEESNLCVLFLQNNRERQIQRARKHYIKICDKYLPNPSIRLSTFMGPLWIWGAGLLLALSLFLIEKLYNSQEKL